MKVVVYNDEKGSDLVLSCQYTSDSFHATLSLDDEFLGDRSLPYSTFERVLSSEGVFNRSGRGDEFSRDIIEIELRLSENEKLFISNDHSFSLSSVDWNDLQKRILDYRDEVDSMIGKLKGE